MATVKKSPGMNATATAIENYIREHRLLPGDMLPSEATLCQLLGVSRSSVREAMRTLASLDVVEIRHGYGTYVGDMSLAPLVNGMVLRMTLNEEIALQTLCHVVETRIALDRAAANDLIEYYATASTHALRTCVNEMRELWERGQSFSGLDRQFHEEIVDKLSNPLLQELTIAMWEIHMRAIPIIGVTTPKDLEDTVDAHLLMVQALERGDADAYNKALDQHYQPLLRVLHEELERQKEAKDK